MKITLFSCLFIIQICLVSTSYSLPKSSPKKGAVMKAEGYYVPFSVKAKDKLGKTKEAIRNGYLNVNDYFAQNSKACLPIVSQPHLLQPSEILNFNFSLKFEGDKASTSVITFTPGSYKFSLTCFDGAITVLATTTYFPTQIITVQNTLTKTAIHDQKTKEAYRLEIQDSSFGVRDQTFCTSGSLVIERLN